MSEYGEKGKEVYTVRTYTADGKAFSERDFGSLKDAKLEETRLGTVIKRNNVAIAEGARDAQWMDTCSERATRTVLSELNGTATEKELTDMLQTAFEKDRNGEQLTDGEKRMLKRFDEVYLQNLRSENADNSSSVRRDFNKSRGVDIDKILAKDYYKWSESEREAVDEYIKALNGENTAKDMPSEQTEPTAPSEPPAGPANEPLVVEAEKGGQQEVVAPEKEAEKPSEETPSKDGVGIEDYIKINKADDETANDIREDAENYTDEVNALRAESEQAVRYSNGESSEKPEHWDYWKEKFGLEEPKAKTEKEVQSVEEPKADSEPIEPADEKPTEQPKEPKAEEKPVEVETPKEEANADTKAEVEQAAGTKPVEEVDKHKEEQLDIINKSNPMHDEYHTGVRNVDDIKTFEEAVSDSDAPFTPDYTKEDAESALKAGERGADRQGGTGGTAEEGSNHVTGTAAKAADKDSYDVTEDTAKYRIREDAPPTKTGIGYKVFVLKDGKLYPPMVANPNGEATPVGVWLDADAAPVIGVTKTGRQQVKAGGKGTQGGSGKLAYRPGWHLGEIPYALQFNRMNPETGQRELFPANFVWAEVEYANDVDYQEEAMSYGMKASGKFQHSLAGLPRLPKNGSYRYRTNPDPNTDPWVITGAMKVNRILKPSEVDAMIEAAGREPQQRQAGSITDKQVEALNAKVERTMQEDRDMMRSVVQQMGEKLHTDINIIEDVNEITHSNAAVQERRRKSKGWYDTKTGQVNIVLANNRDVDDVKASVGHEVIAHKGLRELFGEENYDQFLDETYQHLRDDLKKGVDAASGRSFVDDATKNGNRAKSYEQHRRAAVDELFGRMAEKPFEEFSEGERTLWQKTKATVRRLLDKFLGSLKLPKWFELSDNELRYILWRSKERLERGKEHPIDLARDIVKREELGLTDEALYNMGDNPETFAERQRRAVEKKGVVMSGLNSAEVTAVKVPKHPYTGNIAHATEQAKAAAIEKYTEIIKDERGKEKRVAKPQTYDNYGVTFQYGISADAIDEYLNPRQQAKSVNKGVHLALAEHIHEVIGASIEVEEHPDRMKVEGERSNNQFNPNSLMHRFYGVVLVDGHPYRVMTLMREEKNPAVGNGMHAYEVQKIEVIDEETPNTPNGTDSQNHNGLSYPVAKVIEKVEKTMESGKKLLEESKIADEDTAMYRDPGETEDIRFRKVEGYDSKHAEIEQAVNKELEKNSTSDDIKAEIDRVKKLRAEATKEYLSGKPHSEVAKGDAAALRERLNELNAKKTVAVENERSAKLTEKLADLNSKLIEATESGDAEKVKSLTTEIKRLKTDIGNTGIRSRYKAKISEIKSKSENVSDLAKSLVKYISGELSPILAKEMGKAEFNALVGSVRDIAKQWNAKDGTEQDRNNLATKLDDTIRKVDDVIVGIETRKLTRDLADMLSVKTTKKDSSGKKIGVKVSNTVRIAIETLKGMFRGFDGEFGNGLKSLVKSLDGMLAKKKSLQGRLKELELSEASANERLNSGAITKDEYDAEVEAINRERDDVKSEMADFDTVFSDALSETNDAIDTAVPMTTVEYDKLWNDLTAKQQDEQDGVAQMSAHDKEMLKIMPFVRSLVDVREMFAGADKSQSRLKALEELN